MPVFTTFNAFMQSECIQRNGFRVFVSCSLHLFMGRSYEMVPQSLNHQNVDSMLTILNIRPDDEFFTV